MRAYSANWIFPISAGPIPEGVVVCLDDGTIDAVYSREEAEAQGIDKEKIIFHEGAICPGFVNAHGHLELSHMRGIIPTGTGLPGFIRAIMSHRDAPDEVVCEAMLRADAEMQAEGIVAAGDISNRDISFSVKTQSPVTYHTFIELPALDPEQAGKALAKGMDLYRQAKELDLRASVSPHAPYSASTPLLNGINELAYKHNMILTIHNQECAEEEEMFRTGKGTLADTLAGLGVDTRSFKATGFSSLSSTLVHLGKCQSLLLVHNTFATADDIDRALHYSDRLWWCLCPNANLYIEKRLPDIALLRNKGVRLTLGTDSLSSNTRLSILAEMYTIQEAYPRIPVPEILRWATLNGAEFLQLEKTLGSLESGKKPGLNLISPFDVQNVRFLKATGISPL